MKLIQDSALRCMFYQIYKAAKTYQSELASNQVIELKKLINSLE